MNMLPSSPFVTSSPSAGARSSAISPFHVGIDVSKARLDVALYPSSDSFAVANTAAGHDELVSRLVPLSPVAIVLEASGGYERDGLAALLAAGLPVQRVNPYRVRQFARSRGILAKTDRLDARVLAAFAATMPLRLAQPLSAEQTALAELVGARQTIAADAARARLSAQHWREPALVKLASRRLAALKDELAALDKLIAAKIRTTPEFAQREALLHSIPGVGPVLAATLLAKMPELGNISRREAAALVGVAPFACDSGTLRGKRMIWGGRAEIRTVLYMGAVAAIRCNPPLKAFYERLIKAGKPRKLALTAVMRKLLTVANAIAKSGQLWSPPPL